MALTETDRKYIKTTENYNYRILLNITKDYSFTPTLDISNLIFDDYHLIHRFGMLHCIRGAAYLKGYITTHEILLE